MPLWLPLAPVWNCFRAPFASALELMVSGKQASHQDRAYTQQGIVFLPLVVAEGNPVDVLGLGRKLEIHKFHILLAAEAEVVHKRLQQFLGARLTLS